MSNNIKHDAMRKEDISSIYCRRAHAAPLAYWPEAGFAVPCVDGTFYVNHSDKDLYICATDGVRYKVPRLADEHLNGVLAQLYVAMGGNASGERWETGRATTIPGMPKGISIEPNAICENKETKRDRVTYRNYESSQYANGDVAVNFIQETSVSPIPPQSADSDNIRRRNEVITMANAMDDNYGITRNIRSGFKGVTVFKAYNEHNLRYGHGYNQPTRGSAVSHQQADAFYSSTFEILDESKKFEQDGGTLLNSHNPYLIWNYYDIMQIQRTQDGLHLPANGATVGLTGTVKNKHFSLYDPSSDNYVAKAGIRFIVPQHATRTSRLFVKLGEYIQELVPTIDSQDFENQIVAFVTGPNGDEIRVGSGSPDIALSRGLDICLPDGTKWNIPFFDNRQSANVYLAPHFVAKFKAYEDKIKAQTIELDKFKAAAKKEAEQKRSTIIQYIASMLTQKTVITAISGLVVAGVMAAIGYFTGKN